MHKTDTTQALYWNATSALDGYLFG